LWIESGDQVGGCCVAMRGLVVLILGCGTWLGCRCASRLWGEVVCGLGGCNIFAVFFKREGPLEIGPVKWWGRVVFHKDQLELMCVRDRGVTVGCGAFIVVRVVLKGILFSGECARRKCGDGVDICVVFYLRRESGAWAFV
jgi:hypothetical protein